MMVKFYIGQKVKCIDTSGTTYLNKKEIYTVYDIVESDCIKLQEIVLPHSYFMTRFVCIKSDFYKELLDE